MTDLFISATVGATIERSVKVTAHGIGMLIPQAKGIVALPAWRAGGLPDDEYIAAVLAIFLIGLRSA